MLTVPWWVFTDHHLTRPPPGHPHRFVCRYAGVRLAAQRSLAGWLSETTGGLSYLEFIRTLSKRVEEDWQGVQVRPATSTYPGND